MSPVLRYRTSYLREFEQTHRTIDVLLDDVLEVRRNAERGPLGIPDQLSAVPTPTFYVKQLRADHLV